MSASKARSALGLALVRLRFVGVLALVALLVASKDRLSTWARQWTRPAPHPLTAAQAPATTWVCPMHPEAAHDGPGKCAMCGMALREVAAKAQPAGELSLDAVRAQQAGLALAEVQRRALPRVLSTTATLEPDDRRIARVPTRLKAVVETLHVSGVGDRVKKGQPLALLQAPDLLAFTPELIKENDARKPYPVALERFRLKLRTMGATPLQIAQIERTRDPLHLEMRAPISGVVLEKMVVPGDLVQEGAALFTIADLSRLWVVARVYQDDAPLLSAGAEVEVQVQGLPGRTFRGKVSRVDAAVDRETRTLAVRALLDNADGALRPGMSARATFRLAGRSDSAQATPLVVPEGAVVERGEHSVVWREVAPLRYAPVEVTVLSRDSGRCAVAGPLAEGDRVVAEGAFLLSAEARLTSARPAGTLLGKAGP